VEAPSFGRQGDVKKSCLKAKNHLTIVQQQVLPRRYTVIYACFGEPSTPSINLAHHPAQLKLVSHYEGVL